MPEARRRSRQLLCLEVHRFADQPSEPAVLLMRDVPCQSVVFGLEPAGIPLQRVETREAVGEQLATFGRCHNRAARLRLMGAVGEATGARQRLDVVEAGGLTRRGEYSELTCRACGPLFAFISFGLCIYFIWPLRNFSLRYSRALSLSRRVFSLRLSIPPFSGSHSFYSLFIPTIRSNHSSSQNT